MATNPLSCPMTLTAARMAKLRSNFTAARKSRFGSRTSKLQRDELSRTRRGSFDTRGGSAEAKPHGKHRSQSNHDQRDRTQLIKMDNEVTEVVIGDERRNAPLGDNSRDQG